MTFLKVALKFVMVCVIAGVVGFYSSIWFFGTMTGKWGVEGVDYFFMFLFAGAAGLFMFTHSYDNYGRKRDEAINRKRIAENVSRIDRNLYKIFEYYQARGIDRFPEPVFPDERRVTNTEAYRLLSAQLNVLNKVEDEYKKLESKKWTNRLGSVRFEPEDVLQRNVDRCELSGFVSMMLVSDGNYFERFSYLEDAHDYITDRYRALRLGLDGEELVKVELSKYFDSSRVLYGNRFDTPENGTVENDVLVFGKSGIYSLEVKNILSNGDKYLRVSKDGLWYVKDGEYGSWKLNQKYSDIFEQVNRHIYHTEHILSGVLGRDVEVKPVIVISNNNVVIENESDWDIVRPNTLFMKLKGSSGVDKFSEKELDQLVEYMRGQDLGEGKFEFLDYTNVMGNYVDWVNYYTDFVNMTIEMDKLYDNVHPEYK